MVDLKTPSEIAGMREAGRVVARALDAMHRVSAPGVSLLDLDEAAREVLKSAGATSPFLGYHPNWAPSPFPGVVCASVNDAIVHGVPTKQVLADGDLVSLDFGAVLDGWCGDSAISFIVGDGSAEDLALIDATRQALADGIAAAQVGGHIGDIGHAVNAVARRGRFGNLPDHGGHGIGREMHMDPFVPNEGRRGKGLKLAPGLTIAIEPMFIAGRNANYTYDDDGWTIRSATGRRAAHFEHTIAVTEDGPVILTAL
ncbi:type I methionyl aminopeptidase [Rarobacter faecitabidus]|uniref:Methionine aminopeptidase n=1 Tax=Rarobacter faecitabidus TaxID=13243 RepID=A0A542ZWT3_RARFA|nr:type I methionyl aminopeptidase [Rarobacter faecitabidus]TQL64759.1 methionyl aminopeptidase [Rarobacter faecitabidus]